MFAGSRHLQIVDEAKGLAFPALVMYPTQTPSAPTPFGPYVLDVSPEAPIAPGRHPLVVLSHGNGGSHLLYRALCTHLARHGYVVAMLQHPGNNREDNRLEGTHENLENRPRHLRLTIDAVASDPHLALGVQGDNVAVLGHSIGGYTALAVAGGRPWSEAGREVAVASDPRVRALVLMAPATAWYLPEEALDEVRVPILLLAAEHDAFTPSWQAELVLDGVPDRSQVTYRVVEKAGHFSFLSPFPAELRRPGFLPAADPEGFDREAFHARLPIEVQAYLDARLKGD